MAPAWVAIIATLLLPLFPALSYAKGRLNSSSEYLADAFTVEDGLPSNVVNSIVQTRDGFLWIGTDAGLARFNGRSFSSVPFRQSESPAHGVVRGLAEDTAGNLWVATNAGLVRIHREGAVDVAQKQIEVIHPGSGLQDEVTTLKAMPDGSLWVGTNQGLFHLVNGRLTLELAGAGISEMEPTPGQHLLIVAKQKLFEWDGSRVRSGDEALRDLFPPANRLLHALRDYEGATWFATLRGLFRQSGAKLTRESRVMPEPGVTVRLLQDHLGQLWVGNSTGVALHTHGHFETVTQGVNVRSMFEDRDGNLWVGTNGDGLIRIRTRPVRMFTSKDGLPNDVPMAVLVSRSGQLWVGNNCGGLSRWDGHRFITYAEKDGLTNSCVWSLTEDLAGNLWVGTWGGGVYRFRDGHFKQIAQADGLAGDVVQHVTVARDGSRWVATADGLSHMQGESIRNYTTQDGLPTNRIVTVYEDHAGTLWAGTGRGIARLENHRFVPVLSNRPIFDPRYLAIAEDSSQELFALAAPRGISKIVANRVQLIDEELDVLNMLEVQESGGSRDVWFSSGAGIVRMGLEELQRAQAGHHDPLNYTTLTRQDGLASTQCSVGSPNLGLTADHKLWVATVQGLAMVEIDRVPHLARPAAVFLESVVVGRSKQSAGKELHLSPGPHHVELVFDAIEFTAPEKVRFQYRLDGVDSDWLNADNSRMAVYTQIPPGHHTFRIRACNRSGVWSPVELTYPVTQEPYLYETRAFQIGSVLLIGGLLAMAYRWRLRYLAAQMNARLNERLDERTRLAHDLHDTLLQTLQGTKMVAENALGRPDDLPRMHTAMTKISEWLTQATAESRAVLQSLHSSSQETNNLAEAFRQVAEDLAAHTPMSVEISVEGKTQGMHPIVREEVFRIGTEAIRNAVAHSGGRRIEVELHYGREFVLLVRDDGKGIDPDVTAAGRPGHFGLKGMEDRTQRVGGKLNIYSSKSAGTEIQLIVPCHPSTGPTPEKKPPRSSRLRRLWSRRWHD